MRYYNKVITENELLNLLQRRLQEERCLGAIEMGTTHGRASSRGRCQPLDFRYLCNGE